MQSSRSSASSGKSTRKVKKSSKQYQVQPRINNNGASEGHASLMMQMQNNQNQMHLNNVNNGMMTSPMRSFNGQHHPPGNHHPHMSRNKDVYSEMQQFLGQMQAESDATAEQWEQKIGELEHSAHQITVLKEQLAEARDQENDAAQVATEIQSTLQKVQEDFKTKSTFSNNKIEVLQNELQQLRTNSSLHETNFTKKVTELEESCRKVTLELHTEMEKKSVVLQVTIRC